MTHDQDGKVHVQPEGEEVLVAVTDKSGKPYKSTSLPPDEARDVAKELQKAADDIDARKKKAAAK